MRLVYIAKTRDVKITLNGRSLDIDVEIGAHGHPIEAVRKWRRHARGDFADIDFVMEFAVQ
jgi:hypothetical protein